MPLWLAGLQASLGSLARGRRRRRLHETEPGNALLRIAKRRMAKL